MPPLVSPTLHAEAFPLVRQQKHESSRRALRALCATLATALALAPTAAASQTTQNSAHLDRSGGDSLRIYYVGYPVGYESWRLTSTGSGARTLTADLDYVDRGRRTHLRADIDLADDWATRRLVITRMTDSTSVEEARAELLGRRTARVDYRGRHDTVAVPPHVFAIAGTSPVAQHLALIRYWIARGKPATIAVIPGGPTNIVDVAWRGRDTLQVAGGREILDRYAVTGVVWGTESVWLDARGRLAGYSTAGGGGLTFEAVRLPLDAQLPQLRGSATRDRLGELATLSRRVRPVASGTVALVGATLIDGTGRPAIPDAVVVVADGRVRAAGPRSAVSIPRQAQRIDVSGRTIAPGLWDMHTHLMQVEWAPVYLAAGVTTVRDMGNVTDFIVPFRAAVDSGRALGPRMFLAGLVDGGGPNAFGAENAATPDQGRAVVRRFHELGFQQMKLYSLLEPGVVGAIAREAHSLGMSVTGHVPTALSVRAAVDSGMDHIAHLPIRGDPSSDSVSSLIAHLRERGTVMDPTTSWGELLQHSTAEPVASFQPGVAHLPPVLAQRINAMGANVDPATAHARFDRTLGILRALHDAGVPIVAGTDEGVPGFSVYREVELFPKFGMTPMQALQSASVVGARAMGAADSLGTLEPGKLADLIVFERNPLDDISNVRRVELVMKGGTLYRSRDIWKAIGFR